LTFLLVGVGGLVAVWRGKIVPDGQPAQPWVAPQPAKAADGLATLRGADGGRAILTPRFAPTAKFIVITLIALFWNGVISLGFWGPTSHLFTGPLHWFKVLFLLPFAAIGIILIGGAVYQFLAIFTPRPTIELSSSEIPLGGATELRWRFTGWPKRIDEFTVTLRGVEETKYSQGTGTCTDHHTFYEMELCRTSYAEEIAAGCVGFVVPPDTMHSFEAVHNKILWSVDLHGRIRRWPDVKESFKITVTPAAG
jgi:hypothetical protein